MSQKIVKREQKLDTLQWAEWDDDMILDVQESFLDYGIHAVAVDSIYAGRELLQRFLQNIKCYNRPAFLTTHPYIYEDLRLIDLYKKIEERGLLNTDNNGGREEFMLTSFYYDFLAIECTSLLNDAPWFKPFYDVLTTFGISETLPVIILNYDR